MSQYVARKDIINNLYIDEISKEELYQDTSIKDKLDRLYNIKWKLGNNKELVKIKKAEKDALYKTIYNKIDLKKHSLEEYDLSLAIEKKLSQPDIIDPELKKGLLEKKRELDDKIKEKLEEYKSGDLKTDYEKMEEIEHEIDDIYVSPEQQVILERLETFFKNLLEYNPEDDNGCNSHIMGCLESIYIKASDFVKMNDLKYNGIIADFFEIINKSYYIPSDPKYIANMKRIAKKIVFSNNDGFFDKSKNEGFIKKLNAIDDKIIKELYSEDLERNQRYDTEMSSNITRDKEIMENNKLTSSIGKIGSNIEQFMDSLSELNQLKNQIDTNANNKLNNFLSDVDAVKIKIDECQNIAMKILEKCKDFKNAIELLKNEWGLNQELKKNLTIYENLYISVFSKYKKIAKDIYKKYNDTKLKSIEEVDRDILILKKTLEDIKNNQKINELMIQIERFKDEIGKILEKQGNIVKNAEQKVELIQKYYNYINIIKEENEKETFLNIIDKNKFEFYEDFKKYEILRDNEDLKKYISSIKNNYNGIYSKYKSLKHKLFDIIEPENEIILKIEDYDDRIKKAKKMVEEFSKKSLGDDTIELDSIIRNLNDILKIDLECINDVDIQKSLGNDNNYNMDNNNIVENDNKDFHNIMDFIDKKIIKEIKIEDFDKNIKNIEEFYDDDSITTIINKILNRYKKMGFLDKLHNKNKLIKENIKNFEPSFKQFLTNYIITDDDFKDNNEKNDKNKEVDKKKKNYNDSSSENSIYKLTNLNENINVIRDDVSRCYQIIFLFLYLNINEYISNKNIKKLLHTYKNDLNTILIKYLNFNLCKYNLVLIDEYEKVKYIPVVNSDTVTMISEKKQTLDRVVQGEGQNEKLNKNNILTNLKNIIKEKLFILNTEINENIDNIIKQIDNIDITKNNIELKNKIITKLIYLKKQEGDYDNEKINNIQGNLIAEQYEAIVNGTKLNVKSEEISPERSTVIATHASSEYPLIKNIQLGGYQNDTNDANDTNIDDSKTLTNMKADYDEIIDKINGWKTKYREFNDNIFVYSTNFTNYVQKYNKILNGKVSNDLTEAIIKNDSTKLIEGVKVYKNLKESLTNFINLDTKFQNELINIFVINNYEKWLLFWNKKYNKWINLYQEKKH